MTIGKYKAEILLAAILALSAFLNIWNIWNQGDTNSYYAAAVKTMLVNPVAGFFNSFDPAGFISVDKPPVGLWVQAAFAAFLGVKGWVLVLPQALAGIASVALLYCIVSRPFGKPAGLVAALALALTPIFVAISRNGTMDSQMIFVILLAVWAVLKATRDRSLPWFLAAAVLIGIGFNIKMIQAYIIIPAVLGVYLLGTTGLPWKERTLHIPLAVAVLVVVSLSWAVAVDMVPAGQRPYIGGSGDNTVLGLIVNYNGLHRLGIGEEGGGPGTFTGRSTDLRRNSSMMAAGGYGDSISGPGDQSRSDSTSGSPPGDAMASSGDDAQQVLPGMPQLGSSGFTAESPPGGGMGGGGGMNSGGSPGIFRLFGQGLAGDISWLLLFALIGSLAWIRRPATLSLKGFEEAGYSSEKGLTILAMLLWLIPGLLYFSFTTGFWHDYYIATIAPPIAALVGTGAAGMYRRSLTWSRAGWLLVIAVLATGLVQALFLSYNAGFAGPLIPLVFLGTIACTALLAGMQVQKPEILAKYRLKIVAVALGILFIAPFVWSCTPIMTGNGGTIPTAGPAGSRGGIGSMPGVSMFAGIDNRSVARDLTGQIRLDDRRNRTADTVFPGTRMAGFPSMSGGSQGPGGESVSTKTLAAYLLAHTTNETWILAVPSAQAGADLIIETGRPVMSLGGFSGTDRVLSLAALQDYIREGRVRFFETGGGGGGGGMGGGNSEIFSWVSAHCTAVNLTEESGNGTPVMRQEGQSGTRSATMLYDCLGAAGTA